MSATIRAIENIRKAISAETKDLSKEDYKRVLEEIDSDIEGYLEAVIEELDDELEESEDVEGTGDDK